MVALIILQPEMVKKVVEGKVSGSDFRFLRPSRRKFDPSLNFNFAQTAWKTGVQEPALLLERSQKYGNSKDPSQNLAIIAIARVIGHMRNPDNSRPIQVDDWTVLPQPVPLHDATQRMERTRARLLWSSFEDVTRPLSPRLDAELRAVLLDLIPGYDGMIQSKRRRPDRPQLRRTSESLLMAERRDRYGTALRMFGYTNWSRETPIQAETELPDDLARFQYDLTEQDMLTDDSSAVPGWESVGRAHGGWFEFNDQGRKLLVKNINFQRGEIESGGDLIYVRSSPATVILVQYKRLILQKGKMLYRDPQRLYSQLCKLVSLQEDEQAAAAASKSEEAYRLSHISGFVKFVETRPLKPSDGELLQGYYLPAPYYQWILKVKSESGELHNPTEFVPNRYIDSQTFIRLVVGGWIGSRSAASKDLANKLGAILRESQSPEVTLAVELRG